MSILISNDTKECIVNRYKEKPMSMEQLREEFGYCLPTLSKILKEANVDIYTKQQLYSYGSIEDYFSNIDTEEKAYFLGLLTADGCVYLSNESPRVMLQLKQEDSYIVEWFNNAIKSNRKVLIDKRDGSSTAILTSHKMAEDLAFYWGSNHKFLRMLPVVNPYLLNHLIRGYFDGDGSIGYRLAHPERKVCNSYSARVNMAAHEPLIDDLKFILESYVGITHIAKTRANSKSYMNALNIKRKDDITRFYNFIYSNANIYLIRKKKKFEEFFIANGMI